MYIIVNNHMDKIDKTTLVKAVERTFKHRNTNFDMDYLNDVFEIIKDSSALKDLFNNYSKKLNYAKDVRYKDTINAIKKIIKILESELVGI